MRIKELSTDDLLKLSVKGINAAFFQLIERSDLGERNKKLMNQAIPFRKARYKKFLLQKNDIDFKGSRNWLYNISQDLLSLPLRSISFPFLPNHFKGYIERTSRTIKIIDIKDSLLSGKIEDSPLPEILKKSKNWHRELLLSIVFHNIIYKGHHKIFNMREEDILSFIFDWDMGEASIKLNDKNSIETFKINKNLDIIFPLTKNNFQPLTYLTLDCLNSLKFDDQNYSYLLNIVRHFQKLNGMDNKILDENILNFPKKIGNLSIYTLFPLIKSGSIKKKLILAESLGLKNLYSLSILKNFKFLRDKEVIKLLN